MLELTCAWVTWLLVCNRRRVKIPVKPAVNLASLFVAGIRNYSVPNTLPAVPLPVMINVCTVAVIINDTLTP